MLDLMFKGKRLYVENVPHIELKSRCNSYRWFGMSTWIYYFDDFAIKTFFHAKKGGYTLIRC